MIAIGLTGAAVPYQGTIQDVIWLFHPGAQLVHSGPAPRLHLELGQEGPVLWAEARFYDQPAAIIHRVTSQQPVIAEEALIEI